MADGAIRIESIEDVRLAPYRCMPERTLRGESLFIAEGVLLVRRLLESRYATESILTTDAHADALVSAAAGKCPVYMATASLIRDVAGFNFHRGALALGRRGPARSLDELLAPWRHDDPLALLVCTEVNQAENVGLVFRTAAALGADGVLLGPGSADPLSRRALRLSMGGVLRVPFVQTLTLAQDLAALRSRYGVERVATVLDPQAEPLASVQWARRVALILGNEFDGLSPEWLALADRRVTIPMQPGTDSLNLGVAAGIFAYELLKSRSPFTLAGRGKHD